MNYEPKDFEPTDYLPYDFANRRHIGPSPEEMKEMLKSLGVDDLSKLIDETIPKSIRQKKTKIGQCSLRMTPWVIEFISY